MFCLFLKNMVGKHYSPEQPGPKSVEAETCNSKLHNYTHIFSHASRMPPRIPMSVAQPTTLVQTEISEQLLN